MKQHQPDSDSTVAATSEIPLRHRLTKFGFRLLLLTLPVLAIIVDFRYYTKANEEYIFNSIDRWLILSIVIYAAIALAISFRPKAVPNVALSLYACAISVVAAELVLHQMFPPPPNLVPWPPQKRTFELADNLPGLQGRVDFTINDLGLRGPQVDLRSMDLRILCVGGSTTECLYVTDEESWPWRLQINLAEQLDKKVFVGNAGRSGHFTLHHAYQLRNYPFADSFDWVVMMAGVNDMGWLTREDGKARWGEITERSLHKNPQIDQSSSYGEKRSQSLSMILTWLKIREALERPDVVYQDPEGDWVREKREERWAMLQEGKVIHHRLPRFDEALVQYAENLRTIVQLCHSRDQQILLLTQPALWKPDLPPELERLLRGFAGPSYDNKAYDKTVLYEMMEEMNDVMKQVAREENVDCIDLASLLPKDTTVFYDDNHFNTSGCEKIATILTSFFKKKLDK